MVKVVTEDEVVAVDVFGRGEGEGDGVLVRFVGREVKVGVGFWGGAWEPVVVLGGC